MLTWIKYARDSFVPILELQSKCTSRHLFRYGQFPIPKLRQRPEVDNTPWDCFRGCKQKAGPQNSPVMHCQRCYTQTCGATSEWRIELESQGILYSEVDNALWNYFEGQVLCLRPPEQPPWCNCNLVITQSPTPMALNLKKVYMCGSESHACVALINGPKQWYFEFQKCLAMCMDRYMDTWNTISKAYSGRLQREHGGGSHYQYIGQCKRPFTILMLVTLASQCLKFSGASKLMRY